MKKILLMLALSVSMFAADIGGEFRAFSFNRSFNQTAPDAKAITVGGIVRYSTTPVNDITGTVAYYGSYNTHLYSDNDGKNTALLQTDGKDIGFFGEANLKYDDGSYQVIAGNQRLSTPLANDHDLRLLPSTYQGVTAMYKPWGIQVGHMTKYSGFGSKFDGLKEIPEFNFIAYSKNGVNAQYVHSDIRDYYYADCTKTFGQFTTRTQVGGNKNDVGNSSVMYGAKVSYAIDETTLSVLGDVVRGNNFRVIESGAMYTDLMQGYGLYEPSRAYGASVSQAFGPSSVTLTAVNVTGGIVDDYIEYQADVIYQITNSQKLRVRYSDKHQTPESAREDRKDLRVIYYYAF